MEGSCVVIIRNCSDRDENKETAQMRSREEIETEDEIRFLWHPPFGGLFPFVPVAAQCVDSTTTR